MRYLLTLCFGLIAFCGRSQRADSFINATEATRIISFLASDSLKGRANFSKEIEKAAVFIADEFQKNGLKPFGQNPFFLQPFLLLDKTEPLEQVVLNDQALRTSEYVFISPFRFPPTVQLEQFEQKRFSNAVSVREINDSLEQWKKIDRPLLLLLPKGKKLLRNLSDLPFHAHIRLIIEQPAELDQLSVYFKTELRKKMMFNILGYLPGRSKPGELVLITAHYDHVGYLEGNKEDSVFNGANDNASGTASMMMIANYLAARNDNERSVLFVAFAGEEIGLIGSQYLASVIDTDSIIAVINLEMLGKSLKKDKHTCIVTGTGPLPDFFIKRSKKSAISIRYDNNIRQNLFSRSDNYPFSRKGVPAHTFMIYIENDPDYHHVSDAIETLDLENMAEIVKGLLGGIEELLSGRFTPKR